MTTSDERLWRSEQGLRAPLEAIQAEILREDSEMITTCPACSSKRTYVHEIDGLRVCTNCGTAERHDGIHAATGLVVRHLVDLEWSRGWLAAIADEDLEAMSAEDADQLRHDLDAVDDAEIRYLACDPAARDAADKHMRDTKAHGADQQVAWWQELSAWAQLEQMREDAARDRRTLAAAAEASMSRTWKRHAAD